MCGIGGLVLAEPMRARGWLLRVASSLAHRGPDDEGYLVWNGEGVLRTREVPDVPFKLGLAHRRLAIIDLSEGGWQPMGSADGRYFVVFNGEVYNFLGLRQELEALGHRFRSNSDTEVILHAYARWGVAFLRRLRGMFALALWDVERNRLLLARDFFGIKPLYFARWRYGIAFASEIPPLLQLPGVSRKVNPARLYAFLRFGLTDYGEDTLYLDIHQLPPAHYLEIDVGNLFVEGPFPYWDVDLNQKNTLSFAEARDHLRELFLESLRLHLISDVPIAATLSGGVDSSSIVSGVRHLRPHEELHVFSFIADDPAVSEEPWVRIAAEHTQAVVHAVRVHPSEMVREIDDLIQAQGEPFGSTSIYAQYRVFRAAKETGFKVVLDGQGADEILAGYDGYISARLASLIFRGRWLEASRLALNAVRRLGPLALIRLGRYLLPLKMQGLVRRWVGEELVPAWLDWSWFVERGVRFGDGVLPEIGMPDQDVLRGELYKSLRHSSLPMLLRYEDRNSMVHSVEGRVPFLTLELVEFLLGLPEEFILPESGVTKFIFREAMRGLVPDAILNRKDKKGFPTPELSWLRSMAPWVQEVLHEAQDPLKAPYLRYGEIMREWSMVLQGHARFNFRFWRWINVLKWVELFQVDVNP
ncbi:MAG: asparagine synthase (glutamine-hydrolyzing) [Thermus sp.]|uniref:asparagine synthase (glutamine-hydrolyzing) n=1 Tax=Thermus sp. TaxID=275 RepID=UPI00391BAABD